LAIFAKMASTLQSNGQTVSEYLASLYDEYGQFATLNSYWISRDPSKTAAIFDALRTSGPEGGYPDTLGPWRITRLKDITKGRDSAAADGRLTSLPIDASGQMLSFELAVNEEDSVDGLIGTIRSSGTEPKIKYYLEGWGRDKTIVEAALSRLQDAIALQWMRVSENGLEGP
jgi:phosphoglucomutase